ncbi:MAG: hypothetical protein Q4G05_00195 [Clostridia bacterium]|nr:hypothetical protein [Clostridia bacterium]
MIKKRILAIMLILCMCIAFIPTNVFAENTYTITISAENGFTLEADNNMLRVRTPNGGNDVITFVDISNTTTIDAEINVLNNGATVKIPVGTSFKLDFHYDLMNVKNSGSVITQTDAFNSTSSLEFKIENLTNPNPGGPGPEEPPIEAMKFDFTFNGKSFTNVSIGEQLAVPDSFNMDNITEFYVTKIAIGDDKTYTYAANEYSYALLDSENRHIFETHFDKKSDNYANIRIEAHSNDLLDKDIAQDKTKEDYFGFYITGITFVKSGFKGVEVSTNVMPDNYDFTIWNGADLSATTKSNPGKVTAYYGENTISLSSITSSKISEIKLADDKVPSSAVSINSETGKITILSNYYNEIPVQIKLEDGTIGYITINRIGIFIGDVNAGNNTFYHGAFANVDGNLNVDTDKYRIAAVFYHEDTTTCNDYDLIVNATYKDGSIKTTIAQAVGDVHNSSGNISGSDYILWKDVGEEAPKSVSVTAVKKGATTNKITFSGATFGAGAGVEWINNK